MIGDFLSSKEELMLQVGDDINYTNSKKETFPGKVLEIKKRVKIRYYNMNGQNMGWVHPDNLELQDTSRCAHNAECGWCEDTGTCIYDQN